MRAQAAVAALLCAVALLVSGCQPDPWEKDMDKVNELFSELMKRPDLEQIQSDYLALLELIRTKLVDEIGMERFIPDKDPVRGAACPGDLSAVDEAEVRHFRSGYSPGNISDVDWPKALQLVTELARRQGFQQVAVVIDKPGDHEVAIRDPYGGEIIFGTAKNTILSAGTGCHLAREAHQRGTPAPEEPLY